MRARARAFAHVAKMQTVTGFVAQANAEVAAAEGNVREAKSEVAAAEGKVFAAEDKVAVADGKIEAREAQLEQAGLTIDASKRKALEKRLTRAEEAHYSAQKLRDSALKALDSAQDFLREQRDLYISAQKRSGAHSVTLCHLHFARAGCALTVLADCRCRRRCCCGCCCCCWYCCCCCCLFLFVCLFVVAVCAAVVDVVADAVVVVGDGGGVFGGSHELIDLATTQNECPCLLFASSDWLALTHQLPSFGCAKGAHVYLLEYESRRWLAGWLAGCSKCVSAKRSFLPREPHTTVRLVPSTAMWWCYVGSIWPLGPRAGKPLRRAIAHNTGDANTNPNKCAHADCNNNNALAFTDPDSRWPRLTMTSTCCRGPLDGVGFLGRTMTSSVAAGTAAMY